METGVASQWRRQGGHFESHIDRRMNNQVFELVEHGSRQDQCPFDWHWTSHHWSDGRGSSQLSYGQYWQEMQNVHIYTNLTKKNVNISLALAAMEIEGRCWFCNKCFHYISKMQFQWSRRPPIVTLFLLEWLGQATADLLNKKMYLSKLRRVWSFDPWFSRCWLCRRCQRCGYICQFNCVHEWASHFFLVAYLRYFVGCWWFICWLTFFEFCIPHCWPAC